MAPVLEVYFCETGYQAGFEGEEGEGRVTKNVLRFPFGISFTVGITKGPWVPFSGTMKAVVGIQRYTCNPLKDPLRGIPDTYAGYGTDTVPWQGKEGAWYILRSLVKKGLGVTLTGYDVRIWGYR